MLQRENWNKCKRNQVHLNVQEGRKEILFLPSKGGINDSYRVTCKALTNKARLPLEQNIPY